MQILRLSLHLVTNWKISGNVDSWFYGNGHPWGQRHIKVDERAIVDVHANIVAKTVRIQLPHQLEDDKE